MKLFKKKTSNNLKLNILNRLKKIDERACKLGLYDFSLKVNRIINLVDDNYLLLDNDQYNKILIEIDKMNDTLMLKNIKLFSIQSENIKIILSGEYNKLQNQEYEEKALVMISKQKEVSDNITLLKKQMDDCLGKDKATWQMLNSKLKGNYQKLQIYSNTYSLLIKQQALFNISTDLEEAKNEAESILEDNLKIDKAELEQNSEVISNINEDITEKSDEINSLISNHFGINDLDDEYEKAVLKKAEQKTKQKALNSNNF